MDVRAKQRLCYQRCFFSLNLRGGGFAPRHLSRWAASCEMEWLLLTRIFEHCISPVEHLLVDSIEASWAKQIDTT